MKKAVFLCLQAPPERAVRACATPPICKIFANFQGGAAADGRRIMEKEIYLQNETEGKLRPESVSPAVIKRLPR